MRDWLPYILLIVFAVFLWRVLVLRANGAGWFACRQNVELVGQEGIAHTILRPCGIAKINGKRVDVLSSGDLINVGEQVKVIQVARGKVIVERVAL